MGLLHLLKQQYLNFTALCVLAIICFFLSTNTAATRPLEGEERLKKDGALVLESLQRGPVPPSGRSPCTYIPGRGSGRCPLNGKKVARQYGFHYAPPAYPTASNSIVEFGIASATDDTHSRQTS